jgi:hypothetical protein
MSQDDGWDVIENIKDIHIFPAEDIIEHVLLEDCVCGPSAELHGRWLYIHHSLDGRERFEE